MARAPRSLDAGQGRRRLNPDDTIVALSSGAPPAAIAIVRISGRRAFPVGAAVAGALPTPRQAAVRVLRDGGGDPLDRALVLTFGAPASATGEDMVEFHCHGGRAVVDAVLAAVLRQPGTREAAAGEFTRRALANGRIDLAEAEGLADLLAAETETQRRAAMAAAEGRVSRAVRGWLDRLAGLAAEVEASIDYAEEGDVVAEGASLAAVTRGAAALADDIGQVLAAPPVERWRDGFRIAVAGPPNAGKSTLVNLMAARDAAIVAPVAGTTRDLIEVPVRRRGVGYVLIDTAGLREAGGGTIERAGMKLARSAMATAHLVLWLGKERPAAADHLWIHARADRPDRRVVPAGALAVSQDDGASIERLWQEIDARASLTIRDVLPLHQREWQACADAVAVLRSLAGSSEIIAEELRQAANILSGITGANATEAMLDALFSRFCVGK